MPYDTQELEIYRLKQENAILREMIPLLRSRLESFLLWFENTIASIH